MPRDSSGNYVLPAGNPVVSGTVIEATWANPTMSDIATEMTQSLDRNGRGGMLQPLRLADGATVTPAMAFTNEVNTGLYRPSAGQIALSIAGLMRFVVGGSSNWAIGPGPADETTVQNEINGGLWTLQPNLDTQVVTPGAGGLQLQLSDGALRTVVEGGSVESFIGPGVLNAHGLAVLGSPVAVVPQLDRLAAHVNLRCEAVGAATTVVNIRADSIQLVHATSGALVLVGGVDVDIDATVTGANGHDTGTLTPSTWHYGFVIAKADGTVAGLVSDTLSPTLPTDYVYIGLACAVRYTAGSVYRQFGQRGTVAVADEVVIVTSAKSFNTWTNIQVADELPTLVATKMSLNAEVANSPAATDNARAYVSSSFDTAIDGFAAGARFLQKPATDVITASGVSAPIELPIIELLSAATSSRNNIQYQTASTANAALSLWSTGWEF